MRELRARHVRVLELLDEGRDHEYIGRVFRVSADRIRQVEAQARAIIDWQDFLDELDRRIDENEDKDPARAARLKAMRPTLRSVDPGVGAQRLEELAAEFGLEKR